MSAVPQGHSGPRASSLARFLAAYDRAASRKAPSEPRPPTFEFAAALCASSEQPMCLVWGPERIGLPNDAWIALLGVRSSGELGGSARDPLADVWPALEADLERAFSHGSSAARDGLVSRGATGGERVFACSTTPIADARGVVAGVLLIASCAARAEGAAPVDDVLRESEERFRNMADHSPLMLWVTDETGACTYINQRWCDFTGQTREEALGLGWVEAVHPDDRQRTSEAFLAANALRGPFRVDYRLRTKDGEYRWAIDAAAPRLGPDGEYRGYIGSVIDIQERKESEDALLASQAESDRQRRVYEAILTNTPDLAYVFDLEHRFIYANEVLLKMWGRTWDEAIGKTCLELGYEPWHAAMHDREIDQVVATKAPVRGEVPFAGTFGRRVYDYIFVPVFGTNGEVEVVAGTTRDVTDRKQQEEEREHLLASERAARADAERAGRLKDEFLATLSHELRTPLNAVLGWAAVLRAKTPDATTLEQGLVVIERNARLQAQLIADLLDMSRIISGKMRLEVQRVELPLVIEAAVDSIRQAADAKGVRIQSILEPVQGALHGDPARLQQVVWNLVSNSVKFTPRGGRVLVVLARVNSHVEISVSDTGKGIAPEFLPHVFERFRQADSSAAREHGGLGLGLAIVKQLVELHGGSVVVASEGPDRGATFTVRLPLSAVRARSTSTFEIHPHTPTHAPLIADLPDLAGVRVLVLDDEADARDLIQRVLEDCGATVVAAASAAAALDLARREPLHVIVSDIGMPEQDGYAFMRELRRAGNQVPAAALTAFARSEDRMRALQAGFQTHIAKPVEPVELLAVVAALVQKSASRGSRDAP